MAGFLAKAATLASAPPAPRPLPVPGPVTTAMAKIPSLREVSPLHHIGGAESGAVLTAYLKCVFAQQIACGRVNPNEVRSGFLTRQHRRLALPRLALPTNATALVNYLQEVVLVGGQTSEIGL